MHHNKELLKKILYDLEHLSFIKAKDMPDIELYMDQVTTYMDKELSGNKRSENESILTKTMINNYTKNRLLPPPIKKKYTKEHMILLIFIYYFKNVLSFTDIEEIFKPIRENYLSGENEISLETVYTQVFSMSYEEIERLKSDVLHKYDHATEKFKDYEDADRLTMFAFICELAFDIYLKKRMIEQIIDKMHI